MKVKTSLTAGMGPKECKNLGSRICNTVSGTTICKNHAEKGNCLLLANMGKMGCTQGVNVKCDEGFTQTGSSSKFLEQMI
jgi:hypothetical protein